MNRNLIVAVVLGLLLLVSVVQAFQLNSLKDKVKDGGGVKSSAGGGSSSFAAQSSGQGSPAVPSNLQNLPNMVGGC